MHLTENHNGLPDLLPTQENDQYGEMSASGGSMDINPEPFGMQNGTAPLQYAQ